MNEKNRIRSFIKSYERELSVVLGIFLMGIIFTVFNPIYVSFGNIKDIVDQSSIYGVLALGMAFTIISGGIDLSAGAIVALVGVISAKMLVAGINPWLCIFASLIIGGAIGAVNGFLISKMHIQPFVATLATMNVFRGIAYLITEGFPVSNLDPAFRNIAYGKLPLGIRASILIFIIGAIATHIILKYTRFGTYVYAIGGNREAARLAGVKCEKIEILAYTLGGICFGLGAVILNAKLGTAEATAANGYELQAIAAVAIGGASMAGGRGTILGTFLGAILLTGLRVGLIVIGINPYWQYVATGLVIVVAVYIEVVQSKIKGSRNTKKKE